MVRFPLVTVLAREPRLKVLNEAVEMVRVPLLTIMAREISANDRSSADDSCSARN